jgi:hypothetical protein
MPSNIIGRHNFGNRYIEPDRPANGNIQTGRPIVKMPIVQQTQPIPTSSSSQLRKRIAIMAGETPEQQTPILISAPVAFHSPLIDTVTANDNAPLSQEEMQKKAMEAIQNLGQQGSLKEDLAPVKDVLRSKMLETNFVKVLEGDNFVSDLLHKLGNPRLVTFLSKFLKIDKEKLQTVFSEVQRLSAESLREQKIVDETTKPQELSISTIQQSIKSIETSEKVSGISLTEAKHQLNTIVQNMVAAISLHSKRLIEINHELALAKAALSREQSEILSGLPGNGDGLRDTLNIFDSLEKTRGYIKVASNGVSRESLEKVASLTQQREQEIEALLGITTSLVDVVINLFKKSQAEKM